MVLANPYLPVLMAPAGQQEDPTKITGANVGQYDLNDVTQLYEEGGEDAITAKYGADSIANIRSQVTGMQPPASPQAQNPQQQADPSAAPTPPIAPSINIPPMLAGQQGAGMSGSPFGGYSLGSRGQMMPPMMGMGMGGMMPMMGMNPMMGMGIGACPPQPNEPLAYYQQQS